MKLVQRCKKWLSSTRLRLRNSFAHPSARTITASAVNLLIASGVSVIGVAAISAPLLFVATLGISLLGYLLIEAFLTSDQAARSRWLFAGVIVAIGLFVASGYLYLNRDETPSATPVETPEPPPPPQANFRVPKSVPERGAKFTGTSKNLAPGGTLWLVDQDEFGDYWALESLTPDPRGRWTTKVFSLNMLEDETARVSVAYAQSAAEERMLYDNAYELDFIGIPRARILDLLLVTKTVEVRPTPEDAK